MSLLGIGYVNWHTSIPILYSPSPFFPFLLPINGERGHGPLCPLIYASDRGVARICQLGVGGGAKRGSNATERGGGRDVSPPTEKVLDKCVRSKRHFCTLNAIISGSLSSDIG